MKIFIDFDDVIFNTQRFRIDFQNIFSPFGVTEDIFSKNYYNYPPNKKSFPVKTYILEKHLAKISRTIALVRPILEKNIQIFLQDTRRYVFPDAEPFLQKFSPSELLLISYGNDDFQRKKIKNTQLGKYFSVIKISSVKKSQDICPWMKNSKGNNFFLDDRVHYLEEVKRCLPEITTILICRPEGRYHDRRNHYCDFTAKNLKEAFKIISKLSQE